MHALIKCIGCGLLGPRTWEWLRVRRCLRRASGEQLNRIYDYLTEEVLRVALRPHSLCVDVGCNEGYILRMMTRYAPQGAHMAFEPLPHLYRQLLADFADNPCRFHNVALSDTIGTSDYWMVAACTGYSGLKQVDLPDSRWRVERLTVAVDTLDRLVRPEESVALIKIDVEGGELRVMRGARATLRRCRPLVIFETLPAHAAKYGEVPMDAYRFLTEECGLRVSLMEDWLGRRPALHPAAFERCVGRGVCYFMGHP